MIDLAAVIIGLALVQIYSMDKQQTSAAFCLHHSLLLMDKQQEASATWLLHHPFSMTVIELTSTFGSGLTSSKLGKPEPSFLSLAYYTSQSPIYVKDPNSRNFA